MMTEKRMLQVRLDVTELSVLGGQLARQEIQAELIQAEASATATKHRKALKETRKTIRELAKAYDSGVTEREVECKHVRDLAAGRLRVIRTDTGEIVDDRLLTKDERQAELFSQRDQELAEAGAKGPDALAEVQAKHAEEDGRVKHEWSPKEGKEEGAALARAVFGDKAVDAAQAAGAKTEPSPALEGAVPWNGSLVGLDVHGRRYQLTEEDARKVAAGQGQVFVQVVDCLLPEGTDRTPLAKINPATEDIVLLEPPKVTAKLVGREATAKAKREAKAAASPKGPLKDTPENREKFKATSGLAPAGELPAGG